MDETSRNIVNDIVAFVRKVYPIIIKKYKPDSFELNEDNTKSRFRLTPDVYDSYVHFNEGWLTCDQRNSDNDKDEFQLHWVSRDHWISRDQDTRNEQNFRFVIFYNYDYEQILIYWYPDKSHRHYCIEIDTEDRKIWDGWEK